MNKLEQAIREAYILGADHSRVCNSTISYRWPHELKQMGEELEIELQQLVDKYNDGQTSTKALMKNLNTDSGNELIETVNKGFGLSEENIVNTKPCDVLDEEKTEQQIRLEVIEELKKRLWAMYRKEMGTDSIKDIHISFDLILQELTAMKDKINSEDK